MTTTNSLNNQCLNDFTVTSAAAAVRTLTCSNTTNGAASGAKVLVQTAGAAATGNAVVQIANAGGQTWSLGLNNNATQAFQIASSANLGTTNVFTCSTTGSVKLPLTPSFQKRVTIALPNVTGAGVNYVIQYQTSIYDQQANVALGVFTAPIAGNYLFCANVVLYNIGAPHYGGITLMAGGVILAKFDASFNNIQENGYISASLAGIAQMALGDTAYVSTQVYGGTQVVGVAVPTCFSGQLIS